MDDELEIDPATIQATLDDEVTKLNQPPTGQPGGQQGGGQTGQPTGNANPPAPDPRLDRAHAAAEQELTDWWTDTGLPTVAFDIKAERNDKKAIVITATWDHDNHPYSATFDATTGWVPEVSIETRTGTHKVADRKAIDKTLKEEADLIADYIKRVSKWAASVGITAAPAIKINFAKKTIHFDHNGQKFVATIDGNSLKVKLIVEVTGRSEPLTADVNTKEEFDQAIANPPQLTPEEFIDLQAAAAQTAFAAWFGAGPSSYRRLHTDTSQIILQAEVNGRLFIETYRINDGHFQVLAQVPASATGAIENRGRYYAPVATKAEADQLTWP